MSKTTDKNQQNPVSRRKFLELGGVALAAGSVTMCTGKTPVEEPIAAVPATGPESGSLVKQHYRLGRTEFMASDVSMGCGRISESNVVRYAYDKGINYFDVAESYGNGDSETKIGEAMQHMDRKKIFITTKLQLKDEDTQQTILDRNPLLVVAPHPDAIEIQVETFGAAGRRVGIQMHDLWRQRLRQFDDNPRVVRIRPGAHLANITKSIGSFHAHQPGEQQQQERKQQDLPLPERWHWEPHQASTSPQALRELLQQHERVHGGRRVGVQRA